MRKLYACLFVCLALLSSPGLVPPAAWAAGPDANAGYLSLVTWLPGSGTRVDVAVWYPTQRAPATVRAGSWVFAAASNAPPLQGSWPLLIFSPESTGSRFAHHDMASSLAGQGFIVAVPTHDGDNIDDMRLLFTAGQLPARARQLSATLDLVLNHPDLGPVADIRRTTLIGFGNGGSAALLLAGARQTPDLWPEFCDQTRRALPGLPPASPYCEPLMAYNLNRMVASMQAETRREQEAALNRSKAEQARQAALHQARSDQGKAYPRILRAQKRPAINVPSPPVFLPLLPPLARKPDTADPRFKALILVSPGYSMLFDPASLQAVDIPVLVVLAGQDKLNLPAEQGLRLSRLLAPPTPHVVSIEDADLPSFQALCPPDLARDLPDLCATVSPQERMSIHSRLEKLIIDFVS